jgi:cytokinin riboside 5'-monophosphate phosphoribohydrolase
MERICVFCGASVGTGHQYARAARQLGRVLAEQGVGLVYGGGSVGLMGVLADEALAAGGRVCGVIPKRLATRELAHGGLTELHVVGSMHERKALMAELSDAFIALPGGLGTFEELFEVITWTQLGIYRKPVGLLNVSNYFESFVGLIEKAIGEGFVPPEHRQLVILEEEPSVLLQRLHSHVLPAVPRIIDLRES